MIREAELKYLTRTEVPERLPVDVSTCHTIIRGLLDDNNRLVTSIDWLQRKVFGTSSERMPEQEGADNLPGLALEEAQESEPQDAPEDQETEQEQATSRSKRKGHGRKKLPENLPREVIMHDLPESQKVCEHGIEKRRIGEERNEQIEYIPASLKVLVHVRPKYACSGCSQCVEAETGEVEITPAVPQIIPKGVAGPGLLAYLSISKFCYHMPLHRIERKFEHMGYHMARSSMCDWLLDVSMALDPLFGLMKQELIMSNVINADETPVEVQEKGTGKTHKGFVWVYSGDVEHPYVLYDYTRTRSRAGPVAFFNVDGKQTMFHGMLQADAYDGYNPLYHTGKVIPVGCWAHARRYFHKARLSDPVAAHEALHWIKQLYRVERRATKEGLDSTQRLALRRQLCPELLNTLKAWAEKTQELILPKSPIAVAINYMLDNWERLTRYTESGILEIDNNAAERALRPIAVGRKNWNFFGSDRGGHAATTFYSFIESAKRAGHNPLAYLTDVLKRLPITASEDLSTLLPGKWKDPSLNNAQ